MGCIITRMKKCMGAIHTLREDYIRKEMLKASRLQADNKLSEPIDYLALLNQHEHLNNLVMVGKDIMLKQTTSKVHKNRSPGRNKVG